MLPPISLSLSGERFSVTYRLVGDEAEAWAKAEDICLEQTVEFPRELVPEGDIREHIVGRIEAFHTLDASHYEAVISYSIEIAGCELTQLINVVFGNTSIKPGIRVERLDLPASLLKAFRGPRFGREGLRTLLGVLERPLLCTALKPMGLSPKNLGEMAYRLALGGIDIIKDDHGLADQPFSPFHERVQYCVEGTERANRETGRRCLYAPNITSPSDQVLERAALAKAAGAGALLVAPGLIGLDTMRRLAEDDHLALPILSHPAFQGSFVTSPDNGMGHYVLFGQLPRLAGADVTIFPNYGGRFAFSQAECRCIIEGSTVPMAHLRPIFPAPAGGMSLERVPELLQVYGRDVVFLIGGGLHKHGDDLIENCRYFLRLVEQR